MHRIILKYSGQLLMVGIFSACTGAQHPTQVTSPRVANKNIPADSNSPKWPATFNFGKPATSQEIAKLDIDVRPDGQGLPTGSGTAVTGKIVYAAKCAACHGKTGTEGPNNRLVSVSTSEGKESTGKENREKSIGNYWPYATTLFDYIRRAMPFNAPGSLTDAEVYSLTAFLLAQNKIIDPNVVVDAQTLPKISMPTQKYFVTDDRQGGPEVR